jgi:uroporphyrinogen-III synthase
VRGSIVLTGSEGSLSGLARALKERSFDVVERPLLSFAPPVDWRLLDQAIERLGDYAAVAVTSPRAAEALVLRVRLRGSQQVRGHLPVVWASGPATSTVLEQWVSAVQVPAAGDAAEHGAGAALARAMITAGVRGPVLFPCGDRRRDDLPALLQKEGIRVDEVVSYQSVLAEPAAARAAAQAGDVVVVGSPSVVDLLVRACAADRRPDLVVIGPTTAAHARAVGWTPAAVAESPTVHAVLDAVTRLPTRR